MKTLLTTLTALLYASALVVVLSLLAVGYVTKSWIPLAMLLAPFVYIGLRNDD